MDRRNFLQKLTLLLPASSFLHNFAFVNWLFARSGLQQDAPLRVVSKELGIEDTLATAIRGGVRFTSLAEIARITHAGIYSNEEKRKTVLYLDEDRITFTADNTFVILNSNTVLQIPTECIWQDGVVWVPLNPAFDIMSKYTRYRLNYDGDITLESSAINITGVRISPKQNGTLIEVFSRKKFEKREIILDVRNGWFHIDVYGGKIDSLGFANIAGSGIISEVQGIQLGDTASLAFKLKSRILGSDLVFDADSDHFVVNLRTSDEIGEENHKEEAERELTEQRKKWLIDTIVLDAGHGGKDPGAVGYGKLYEKSVVLPIVLKLGALLEQKMPGVKVVYTRKKDVFIPLRKRTQIANEAGGKLFISVHCNSSKSSKPSGFETYFLSAEYDEKSKDVVLKENEAIEFEEASAQEGYKGVNLILATMAQSAFIKQSQFLASEVQSSLHARLGKLGMNSRGVKQGPFWVMVGATMPNVLIETGYISNKREAKILKQDTTQKKIAEAIFEGIKKYKTSIEQTI
jgi:N-acetylmuramoyl-L-alanine amidase